MRSGKRRRSRLGQVADVLEAIESHEGAPATRLASYANMAYDRLSSLLEVLEERGLVERLPGGGYRLTGRGRELLRELRRLRRVLDDFGLELL